jgi:acetyltransferase-like isoleucine patch superfamily enzyme
VTEIPHWHHIPENKYNPHAWILGSPEIGEDCWIGAFTLLDGSGGLTIGRGCHISSGAQLYSHSTVKRVLSGGAEPIERAPTHIGNFVHVGAGAVILMGSTIGDYCVIGAGAVVLQHSVFPAHSVIAGVPAKILGG